MLHIVKKVADLTIDGNHVWFVDEEICGLMRGSWLDGTVEFISFLPEELRRPRSIGKIIKMQEHIYIIPIFGEEIYCYVTNEKRFINLEIGFHLFSGIHPRKMIEAIANGNYLYCINACPDYIIRINNTTLEKEYFDISSYIFEDVEKEEVYPLLFEATIWQDQIMFRYGRNILYRFDIAKDMVDFVCIKEFMPTYEGYYDYIRGFVKFEETRLVCFTCMGKIYELKDDKGIECKALREYIDGIAVLFWERKNKSINHIKDIVKVNETYWIFLRYTSVVILYDKQQNRFDCIQNEFEAECETEIYGVIRKINEEIIYFWSNNSNRSYILDTVNKEIKVLNLKLYVDTSAKAGREWVEKLMISYERYGTDDLGFMISGIKHSFNDTRGLNHKLTCGDRIYEAI